MEPLPPSGTNPGPPAHTHWGCLLRDPHPPQSSLPVLPSPFPCWENEEAPMVWGRSWKGPFGLFTGRAYLQLQSAAPLSPGPAWVPSSGRPSTLPACAFTGIHALSRLPPTPSARTCGGTREPGVQQGSLLPHPQLALGPPLQKRAQASCGLGWGGGLPRTPLSTPAWFSFLYSFTPPLALQDPRVSVSPHSSDPLCEFPPGPTGPFAGTFEWRDGPLPPPV